MFPIRASERRRDLKTTFSKNIAETDPDTETATELAGSQMASQTSEFGFRLKTALKPSQIPRQRPIQLSRRIRMHIFVFPLRFLCIYPYALAICEQKKTETRDCSFSSCVS